MQNEHRKNGPSGRVGDVSRSEHGNGDNSVEYRKILRDLGIEKPEGEPLTDLELRQIFISMQEGLCAGS